MISCFLSRSATRRCLVSLPARRLSPVSRLEEGCDFFTAFLGGEPHTIDWPRRIPCVFDPLIDDRLERTHDLSTSWINMGARFYIAKWNRLSHVRSGRELWLNRIHCPKTRVFLTP